MPTFPASTGQAWYVRANDSGWSNDNVDLGCRVRGKPDRARLQRALDQLVARHASLRTTFSERGGRVLQEIHETAPLQLLALDATDPTKLYAFATEPFQLRGGPLTRAALCKLADDDHLLVLIAHHAVCDGWSWALLYEDLAELYRALGDGRPPNLSPVPITMADYAAWEAKALERPVPPFWAERLGSGHPHLELGRGSAAGEEPACIRPLRLPEVPAAAAERLQQLATRTRTTLARVVGAGVIASVAQYAKQEVTVALTSANRNRPELLTLVGNLADQIPIRIDLHDDPPFTELVRRHHLAISQAYARPFPSEALRRLMRTTPARRTGPLFDLDLNWLPGSAGRRADDAEEAEFSPAEIDVPAEIDAPADPITNTLDRWQDRVALLTVVHQPAVGGAIRGLILANVNAVPAVQVERLGHRITAVLVRLSHQPDLPLSAVAGVSS